MAIEGDGQSKGTGASDVTAGSLPSPSARADGIRPWRRRRRPVPRHADVGQGAHGAARPGRRRRDRDAVSRCGAGADAGRWPGRGTWPPPRLLRGAPGAAVSGNPRGGTDGVYGRVEMTYHADGSLATRKDRNGSVREFGYDDAGRPLADAVTTLASGVDGAVRRLSTSYDDAGRPYHFTSYDAASGGNVFNQVQRTFDGVGNVTAEYQEHFGAVNTGTSRKVQYAYDGTAASGTLTRKAKGTGASGVTAGTLPSLFLRAHRLARGRVQLRVGRHHQLRRPPGHRRRVRAARDDGREDRRNPRWVTTH